MFRLKELAVEMVLTLVHVSALWILICSVLCSNVLNMHKYLIVIHYILQDAMNAIILKQKVRYLDPIAICKSLHAGSSCMKDKDDFQKPCY